MALINNSPNPCVSVIMSVYNSAKYIGEAIESVLAQTFTEFELLIIDDCSTDNSVEIIESFNDDRIVLYRNEENKGLTYNLNRLIEISKGEYIARLDADDVCKSERIERQLSFLEQHSYVQMVYSRAEIFGDETGITYIPKSYEELKTSLVFRNPITHSSVMFRNDSNYMYDETYEKSQDYELWDRMVSEGRIIAGMNECLIKQRVHKEQITKKGVPAQELLTMQVMFRALRRIGVDLCDEEKEIYSKAIRKKQVDSIHGYKTQYKILKQIVKANKDHNIYNRKILKNELRPHYITLLKYWIHHKKNCGPISVLKIICNIGVRGFYCEIVKRIGRA